MISDSACVDGALRSWIVFRRPSVHYTHVLLVGTLPLLLSGIVAPDEEEGSWIQVRRCLWELSVASCWNASSDQEERCWTQQVGECLPIKNILSALVEPPSRTKKNIAELMRGDGSRDLRGLVSGRIESNGGMMERDGRRVLGRLVAKMGEACPSTKCPPQYRTKAGRGGCSAWRLLRTNPRPKGKELVGFGSVLIEVRGLILGGHPTSLRLSGATSSAPE